MKNTIDIEVQKKDFLDYYLKVLTPVINKICHILSGKICYLRDRELKIIAELMYYYTTAPQVHPEEKNKYIFSDVVTNAIMDKYNFSIYNYNNLLCGLRTAGVIQGKRKQRTLHPIFYMDIPEKEYVLTLRFKLT